MQASGYEAPRSIEDTVALLQAANGNARILAGGTDLLAPMRTGVVSTELLVDVKKIPEVMSIEIAADGSFRVGAAVCGAALGEHEALKSAWPGVVEAAELIGSAQIQGRASLGGNLCNASPAADTTPALIAVGAQCIVAGSGGEREIAECWLEWLWHDAPKPFLLRYPRPDQAHSQHSEASRQDASA